MTFRKIKYVISSARLINVFVCFYTLANVYFTLVHASVIGCD